MFVLVFKSFSYYLRFYESVFYVFVDVLRGLQTRFHVFDVFKFPCLRGFLKMIFISFSGI